MKLRDYYDLDRQSASFFGVPSRSGSPSKRIRGWLLSELVESYGLPRSRLGQSCELFDAPRNAQSAYAGFALKSQEGTPFFIGLANAGGNLTALRMEFASRCSPQTAAQAGVISDGTRTGTVFLRRNPANDAIETLHDLDYFKSGVLIKPRLFVRRGGEGLGTALQPLSGTIEDLFFEAHSHIRDIDGLHADAALDELCKLLSTKIYDEITTPAGTPCRFQSALYGSVDECASSIRDLYERSVAQEIRDHLATGDKTASSIFEEELRLSAPAVSKLVDTLEPYDISGSDVDVKGRAFQKVLRPALRAGMGQYFTPAAIIRLIVGAVAPKPDDLVLDPFAGSAHFLTECILHFKRNGYPSPTGRHLFGIEKSPRMVRVALTDMKLSGSRQTNLICTDALLDFANYPSFKENQFDVIMTNPPFGAVLSADAITKLGDFQLARGRKKLPLEIVGLERCHQFLRPGGRLGIVLPESIFTNPSTRFVRAWINDAFLVRAIISLPIETFTPYGANIKTSILLATKRHPSQERNADDQAQAVLIDRIGYDASGRESGASDVADAISALKAFFEKEGW